jgi:hypothetical protein
LINDDLLGYDSDLSVARQEELSEWFANLSDEDKKKVEDIARANYDSAWAAASCEGSWME